MDTVNDNNLKQFINELTSGADTEFAVLSHPIIVLSLKCK